MKHNTFRGGARCGGLEECRYGDPPQAGNSASGILFYYHRKIFDEKKPIS